MSTVTRWAVSYALAGALTAMLIYRLDLRHRSGEKHPMSVSAMMGVLWPLPVGGLLIGALVDTGVFLFRVALRLALFLLFATAWLLGRPRR